MSPQGRTLILLLAMLPAACNNAPPAQTPHAAQRIVSLMPSLTEDLCAMGAAKQLVGVSQFSSDIPCAKNLPQVNDATSVDAERIIALHPQAIVGIPAQQRTIEPLVRAGLPVVLMPDDSYADMFGDVVKLGDVSGHGAQAQALIAALRKNTVALEHTEHFARRPSVFVVVQTNPIWTVGPQSYISTLIQFAGGRNAVAALPQAYAQYSPEALLRLQPDALIASRDALLSAVLTREPWRSLRAVREHHVFILQDSSPFYRPGPRYNQAVSWLIAQLRPLAR